VEHLTSSHVVIEIGSSYGIATNLMAKKARMVVGVETSKECIDKARRDFGHITNLRFELMDILLMPQQAGERKHPFVGLFRRRRRDTMPPSCARTSSNTTPPFYRHPNLSHPRHQPQSRLLNTPSPTNPPTT
jgi:hypothetical protein